MKSMTYSLAPIPALYLGSGKISLLPELILPFGKRALLITGGNSFRASDGYPLILQKFSDTGINVQTYQVMHEPSPQLVDAIVTAASTFSPDVVVGIGGGSVLDAAKAVSAMLLLQEPVKTYLEGVGTKSSHPGSKVPFIAVPTTSGTGSETTKNAVLSEIGEHGYKKSLRHINFVSDITIIDPELMISCPSTVTAYSGMDAFTQLLESYLSTNASAMTEMFALEGLRGIRHSLAAAYHDGSNIVARAGMALAAYYSGITLTNAGLGLVHGVAGVIGGHREIPHGIVCSALMAAANKVTLRKLRQGDHSQNFIGKYATIGKMFSDVTGKSDDYYADHLIETIQTMTHEMNIPKLRAYQVDKDDINRYAALGENKNNPAILTKEEIAEVLTLSC